MADIYKHKIQYYETDKMGITHHSNYVRFMEEARSYILEKHGFGYDKMEQEGVYIPTVAISVDYKKTTTYGEELEIVAEVVKLGAASMELEYTMTRDGEVVCAATSKHCFVDKSGRPIAAKKTNPDIYGVFNSLLKVEDGE